MYIINRTVVVLFGASILKEYRILYWLLAANYLDLPEEGANISWRKPSYHLCVVHSGLTFGVKNNKFQMSWSWELQGL